MLHKVQPNRVIAENHQLMRMVKEALRFNSHDNIFLQPFQEGKQFQPRGEEMLVLIHSIARATEMYKCLSNKPLHDQSNRFDKLCH